MNTIKVKSEGTERTERIVRQDGRNYVCNGWTNWQTWNAYGWISSEYSWLSYIQERLNEIKDEEEDEYDRKELQIEFLKQEWATFVISEISKIDVDDFEYRAEIFNDHALDGLIDWDEILEHIVEK